MMKKTIGRTDITVNRIGLGCMGLSEFYGRPTEPGEAIKLLHQAIELGINHFDTAESYGIGHANETLLGDAFHDRRDQVVIASKFGPLRDERTGAFVGLDGSRANCRRAIEGSLKRLKTEQVDLYYLHRVDPKTPIEESVSAMAEGKVAAIGLSEVSADTIARASRIHPIAAVQSEYSIFSRDIEDSVLPACIEAGSSLVAYSPLGRGMLTGKFAHDTHLSDTDYRSTMQPRFEGAAYTANLELVKQVAVIAKKRAAFPAQIALAWLMKKNDNVLPIPGTTRLENLKRNLQSADLFLDAEDIAALDRLADKVQGTRYDQRGMALLNG